MIFVYKFDSFPPSFDNDAAALCFCHMKTYEVQRVGSIFDPLFLMYNVAVANSCFLAGGGEPQTDKAAIDEAEKRVGATKKDE